METQYVVFDLAQQSFGVPIAGVDSIIKMQPITPLPDAALYLEGVLNLRGTIIPVMDLRKRLLLPVSDITAATRIIVGHLNTSRVGMIVDAVSEVLSIEPGAVEPIPALFGTVDTAYISGIANLSHRLVILLSLPAVLSGEQEKKLLAAAQAFATDG